MATMKEALISKGLTPEAASKFSLYVTNAKQAEAGKEERQRPVSNNNEQQLMALAIKFWNMGILIDGVDAVITGRNMAMVTFNGYKNKVLRTYPETEFDIQLVREGDKFHFSKEDGHIKYTHDIADPFGTGEGKIIGAYVVFKNKRGEFLEALNRADYEEMKKQSKQTQLWGKWESEFWLKSVIKRAAKRHFYDVVAEIDKNDNDDYGVIAGDEPEPSPVEADQVKATIAKITEAEDQDSLRKIVMDSGLMNNGEVIKAYEAMKEMLVEPAVIDESGTVDPKDLPEVKPSKNVALEHTPAKPAETPPTSASEEPAADKQGSLVDEA